MRKYLLIHAIVISFVFLYTPIIKTTEDSQITLRSYYKDLSVLQVQSMSNISIRKRLDYGYREHSTIKHDYDLRAINGDVVVIDHATGLMWHQSGSIDYMKWDKSKQWVIGLNSRKYAGYRSTLSEEPQSLLNEFKNIKLIKAGIDLKHCQIVPNLQKDWM